MHGGSWVAVVTLWMCVSPCRLVVFREQMLGFGDGTDPAQLPADCLSKPCSNILEVSAPHTDNTQVYSLQGSRALSFSNLPPVTI